MDHVRLTGAVSISAKPLIRSTIENYYQSLKRSESNRAELNWISNYLSDRPQSVHYQNALNALADSSVITSGVPQGSILGPLLFVIFVNEMPSTVSRCSVIMYANNTVLFFASQNVEEIEAVLNQELDTLYSWLTEPLFKQEEDRVYRIWYFS
ncbi:Hypothetical predicted protein [Paramuricea clavata]|uniref:Uncharacterized protein n=1 Tax=Paramuricea clavata TaxID=317549 RepID=A0A6S7G4T0_PARCT|nr:Hypothetical predicted protein [Paramuricea clavata]